MFLRPDPEYVVESPVADWARTTEGARNCVRSKPLVVAHSICTWWSGSEESNATLPVRTGSLCEDRALRHDAQRMPSGPLRQIACFCATTTTTGFFRAVPPVSTTCAQRPARALGSHTTPKLPLIHGEISSVYTPENVCLSGVAVISRVSCLVR